MSTQNAATARRAGSASYDLSIRIYVELVARYSNLVEGKVQLTASAKDLAALSLRLADEFVDVEDKVTAGKAPKSAFSLDSDEMAEWSRAAVERKP